MDLEKQVKEKLQYLDQIFVTLESAFHLSILQLGEKIYRSRDASSFGYVTFRDFDVIVD